MENGVFGNARLRPQSSFEILRSATDLALHFAAAGRASVALANRSQETHGTNALQFRGVSPAAGRLLWTPGGTREHPDYRIVSSRRWIVGLVARMAPYWVCDECSAEWFADSEQGPRQCPKCRSRKWNDGMVRDADLYLKALVVRYLNPYRRLLSVPQKAALQRIAANRRNESAKKAAGRSPASSQVSTPTR